MYPTADQSREIQVIVMAGLPGTGKSTLTAGLARRLPALVLSKDEIRSELFPKERIDYSREQDDLCMEVVFIVLKYLLRCSPRPAVIIDGRTFSRSYQTKRLLEQADEMGVKPVFIECVCDDDVARKRLEIDRRRGSHPAGNRTYELYAALKEQAEPLRFDHLVIDTGREPPEQSVERCIAYVRGVSRQG